jgi:tetratricopeptide (TPR) repeat protein
VSRQLSEARQAVDSHADDATANGRLGMLLELYQYPAAAQVAYSRAVILAPDEFRWRYYLGRLERGGGDPAAAVTTLTAALALDPGYVPALVELGAAQLDQGASSEAEAAFREALSAAPDSVAARLGLGRTLAARSAHGEAVEVLEPALARAPAHSPLHYALGLSYRALGRADDAERHLAIAARTGNANPDPDPLLAALADLEVGVDRDYREAKQLYLRGRFTEAIERFQAVVAARPEDSSAYGALGAALMRADRGAEALAAFARSVELDPAKADTSRQYALLLLRARRYAEAEEQLRKVLAQGGDHPDDHHVLGATLIGLGRPVAAIAEFERALELKPDHADARRALTQILWQQTSTVDDDLEAMPYLERLVELEPRHVQAWTVLAGIREGSGDLAGALAALDRALAINPDLAPVTAKRAELRQRLGRPAGQP